MFKCLNVSVLKLLSDSHLYPDSWLRSPNPTASTDWSRRQHGLQTKLFTIKRSKMLAYTTHLLPLLVSSLFGGCLGSAEYSLQPDTQVLTTWGCLTCPWWMILIVSFIFSHFPSGYAWLHSCSWACSLCSYLATPAAPAWTRTSTSNHRD